MTIKPSSVLIAFALVACGPLVDSDGDFDGDDDSAQNHACESPPQRPTLVYASETLGDARGSITVDACRVYWISQEQEFHGEVSSVFKDGSDLRRHLPDVRDPAAVAVVDERIFVLEPNGLIAIDADDSSEVEQVITIAPMQMGTSGTTIAVLSIGQITLLDTETDVVEEFAVDPSIGAIAMAETIVYASTTESLLAIQADTHEASPVADIPWLARNVVADADAAFLVIDEQIIRVDLATGTSEVVIENARGALQMALDDAHLYWVDGGSGEPYRAGGIWAWPRAGGEPFQIAAESTARGIAVDDTSIYWSADAPGKIVRSAKP